MGNTSCCCSCSPSQVDYQNVISNMDAVKEMSQIDELISYIDQLLKAIDEESINSIALLAKTNRVGSSINSAGGLLEKVLKRSKGHICKRDIMPNINRENRRLIIDVTNQAAKIQWLGVALSVVGFVLERIEQISSNRKECIELLRYMCNLAKYIKHLDEHLAQEKLNRVLQFIVKGCLMCISQMQSDSLFKFFAAPVAAQDLQRLQAEVEHEYSELSLEAIIAVLNRIPVVLPPSQGRSPQAVGIEEARNHVTKLLDMESKLVRVVVIYGQGGIGKTTLATAVFSNLDLKNYKYCRVDIQQNCSDTDLKLLQEQILRDLFSTNINLRSLNEGQEELFKAFEKASQPVFIFVDNALKESDLEKLLPISHLASLPAQSRILVTTRNLNETRIILQARIERSSYPVASLPQEEARKLLSEFALGSDQANFDPTIDINGLLQICQGIPLVLKMAGARLCEHAQSVPACRDAVENLKSELLQGAEDELSERMVDFVYNRLKPSCKEGFLDIVFFFCDWEREIVAYSIGEAEFQELERAALVNITDEETVNVHDIVKARGRMLSPDGERITDLQSLTDVLQDVERIKKTKGIVLSEEFNLEAHHLNLMKRCLRVLILRATWRMEGPRIVNGECKGAFENLRLLSLNDYNYSRMDVTKHPKLAVFIGKFSASSNFCEFSGVAASLKYMDINGATLVNLTTTLSQIQSLRSLTLKMCKGFDSLPETIGNLHALEKLNLDFSFSMVSLTDCFGNLTSLKELNLHNCSNLVSLPDSFGNLTSLRELNLEYCFNLVSLPDSFGNLTSLRELNLEHCSNLVSLRDGFGNLTSLKELNLHNCSNLVSLPDSFGNLTSLRELNLEYCFNLVSLPDSFGNLTSLKELNLKYCSSLVHLPDSFGNLTSLRELNLEHCSNLVSLQDSFGNLTSLKELNLHNCSNLVSLPDSFGNLTSLRELNLEYCFNLVSLPDSFGNLTSLRKLNLEYCFNLLSLPDSFGNLTSLRELNLEHCSNLVSLRDSFGNLTSLNELNLKRCFNLVSLPDSFGNLTSFKELNLECCFNLVSIPDSFGNLTSLKELNLKYCSSLVSLPDSFDNLTSLKELNLEGCSSLVSLPDSFGNLASLNELKLKNCSSLVSLPDSFGNLTSFNELNLKNCSRLVSLPDSLGNLTSLKKLNLEYCSSLVSLPDSFGNLTSLIKLKLRSCSSLMSLPDSFGNLCGLVKLYLSSCTQLSVLPESFGNLASVELLRLRDCEKLLNLPQNFGQLKCLKYVSIHGCKVLQSLSGDFECLSSLIAIEASECSQLEENSMDKLEKMKGLMIVDIGGSPVLEKRWEQVKEQYSLAVVLWGRQYGMFPYADVMCRAFFHSESKFVHLDENGEFGESACPAGGVKLWVLLTSASNRNSRWLEAVKKKWMEEGGQMMMMMMYVDMEGSCREESERRVRQALPHLPSGTHAWIAPDNRARILFAYSVLYYYRTHVRDKQKLGFQNCIVSTSTCVDEEGRRWLHDLDFIIPDYTHASVEIDYEDTFDQLISPVVEAEEYLSDYY